MELSKAKLLLENSLMTSSENGQIIRDTFAFKLIKEPETIVEGTGDNKRKYTRLTSLIQKANWQNENGRFYSHDVMSEAIGALKPSIEQRMVLGELDHPDDAKIHTENACLLLTKLWMEGNNVYGQFEILEDLPKGKILKALLDQKITVSISSRGVGDMETDLMEDGTEVNRVLPGFRFVCFDAVNEPSVVGTALHVMESKINRTKKQQFKRINEKKFVEAMKEYLS